MSRQTIDSRLYFCCEANERFVFPGIWVLFTKCHRLQGVTHITLPVHSHRSHQHVCTLTALLKSTYFHTDNSQNSKQLLMSFARLLGFLASILNVAITYFGFFVPYLLGASWRSLFIFVCIPTFRIVIINHANFRSQSHCQCVCLTITKSVELRGTNIIKTMIAFKCNIMNVFRAYFLVYSSHL